MLWTFFLVGFLYCAVARPVTIEERRRSWKDRYIVDCGLELVCVLQDGSKR